MVDNCAVGNGPVVIKEGTMKFYGREKEIGDLRGQRDISRKYARFTVVTGRRRVGKTQLVRSAFDDGESP